jgi:hypothetical protein
MATFHYTRYLRIYSRNPQSTQVIVYGGCQELIQVPLKGLSELLSIGSRERENWHYLLCGSKLGLTGSPARSSEHHHASRRASETDEGNAAAGMFDDHQPPPEKKKRQQLSDSNHRKHRTFLNDPAFINLGGENLNLVTNYASPQTPGDSFADTEITTGLGNIVNATGEPIKFNEGVIYVIDACVSLSLPHVCTIMTAVVGSLSRHCSPTR